MAMIFTHRSFYEVLRLNFPFNLYFDIEHDKKLTDPVGAEAMEIFRKCVINFLELALSLKMTDAVTKPCNIDSGRIIKLDASSLKFSRHLVITLPRRYVFPNNDVISKFVNVM